MNGKNQCADREKNIFDNNCIFLIHQYVCMRFLGPVGLARKIGELDAGTHYEGGTSISTKL